MPTLTPFTLLDVFSDEYLKFQLVYVTAKLGLADLVRETPRRVEELAAEVEVDATALSRFMAALEHLGIVVRKEHDMYQLADGQEHFLSNHPASMCMDIIDMGDLDCKAFSEMLYSVKTGKSAWEKVFGKSYFAYLKERPDVHKRYQKAIEQVRPEIEGIATSYDFTAYKHIIDVGGGNGLLLATLLNKYPHLQATLFDLFISDDTCIQQMGLTDRCTMQQGDFLLHELPREGDLYLLSYILHGLDDARALQVLKNCRQAMSQQARLLIFDAVLQGSATAEARWIDLVMLLTTGGRERTADQFNRLFAQAEMKLTRIIPVEEEFSLIEVAPV